MRARTREGRGGTTAANGNGSASEVVELRPPGELGELRLLARDGGADPVELLERAHRLTLQRSPRFSRRKWGRKLRRACRRADRFARFGLGEPGAGVGWVIDRMLDDQELEHADHASPGTCPAGLCDGTGWIEVSDDVMASCDCRLAVIEARKRAARPRPASLAYYVKLLDRESKRWRRSAKARRRSLRALPAGGAS